MNLLGGTMPEHGMTREEADELVRDLSAAEIEVVRVGITSRALRL
jgi:hypothetical protein